MIANLGVRASYVGNHSTHLPWYNYPINVPQAQLAGSIQPRRPYEPWADILTLASGGDSTCTSSSFQVEYSWTRSLDNVPVVGGPMNPYNARADRGNSDQIRRHIFTALENVTESLELVVRSRGARPLTHLVNFTGEMPRPMRRVMPLKNVPVRLARPAKRAYALVSGKTLPAGSVLAVPRFAEYEVLVVE